MICGSLQELCDCDDEFQALQSFLAARGGREVTCMGDETIQPLPGRDPGCQVRYNSYPDNRLLPSEDLINVFAYRII